MNRVLEVERRYRFMRLFVFFDLPVVTKQDRKVYSKFRKFLVNDGYDMLQFSVYCRMVNGEDAVGKHLSRLTANLPEKGHVRFLQITDKQYGAMRILVGEKTCREKFVDVRQTLLF